MSVWMNVWTVGMVLSAIFAGIGLVIVLLNYSMEGWEQTGYRVALSVLAAFVASPVWPLTLVALLVFLYRRAFPKPTPEDLDERIRRAEREAGIA